MEAHRNPPRLGARAVVAPIRLYQRVVSPLLGPRCRFHPSCSEYAAGSILRFGVLQGVYLGIRRLLRCHPWHPGGIDEVPQSFSWRRAGRPTPDERKAAA